MRRPRLTAVTAFTKFSIIEAEGVAAVVKESTVVVAVAAVASGAIVERAEGVAVEAIGEIAVEEKVIEVVVEVDVAYFGATVDVAMEPNRQVALTPHHLSLVPLCVRSLISMCDPPMVQKGKFGKARMRNSMTLHIWWLPMLGHSR